MVLELGVGGGGGVFSLVLLSFFRSKCLIWYLF